MKLFIYYAFCSVKNQIKKLFRSWVAILLAACILLGMAVGIGAALLAEHFEEDGVPGQEESVLPPETEPDSEVSGSVLELAAAAVILLVLFFHIISADKNGSAIFLMPDVNLLFAAPLKPQSVLLFRLMSQIFVALFASFYLLFQLPNMVLQLGVSTVTAIAVIAVWFLTLVYGRLLNLLVYTVASTHIRLKKYIRPVIYTAVLLIAGSFYLFYQSHSELSLFDVADSFFNLPASRWIPVYGWLKGLIAWTAEGEWFCAVLSLLLLIGGAVLIGFCVWHIKADFYEDAMAKSQETAERMAAAQSGSAVKRKKDRNDRVARDGLHFGSGAQMFFCKTVYNRFRFAVLRAFTKTSMFYLVLSVGISLILVLVAKNALFPVVGLVLCGAAFFRAFGNPLAADVGKDYFVTVPANPYEKVIWSLLGGTVDCALDLLPALAVSAVLLRASAIEAAAYFLLAVGLDFYASNVMLFIELSVPGSLALQVKQVISILFIYFGMLPIAAVVLVGVLLNFYLPSLFIGAVAAVCIGSAFYAFSPLLLIRGRK